MNKLQLPRACPGLCSSSIPPPPAHCSAHATTTTRDCCVAATPTDRLVQSPGGDLGWTSDNSFLPEAFFCLPPYLIWPQGPKVRVNLQLAKDLVGSGQGALGHAGTGGWEQPPGNVQVQSSHPPPPASPTSNPGQGLRGTSSAQVSTMGLHLPKNWLTPPIITVPRIPGGDGLPHR